jgi:hypothetical protein
MGATTMVELAIVLVFFSPLLLFGSSVILIHLFGHVRPWLALLLPLTCLMPASGATFAGGQFVVYVPLWLADMLVVSECVCGASWQLGTDGGS